MKAGHLYLHDFLNLLFFHLQKSYYNVKSLVAGSIILYYSYLTGGFKLAGNWNLII